MKRIVIALSFVITALTSCKKESNDTSNTGKNLTSFERIASSLALPDDANDESRRIFADAQNPDYTIGIIDNPNFGQFSSQPQYSIFMGGVVPTGLTLAVDNDTYTPNAENKISAQGGNLKSYYGKNITATMHQNGVDYSKTFYVPKPVLVNILSLGQSQDIAHTGNTLHWTVDANNPSNYIPLLYRLYNTDQLGTEEGAYNEDIVLMPNTGSYNIDQLMDAQTKKIYFQVVTGNTFATTIGDKKVLFYVSSYDHHEYLVK